MKNKEGEFPVNKIVRALLWAAFVAVLLIAATYIGSFFWRQ